MEILQDLYYTNKEVVKKTLASLLKNWPLIFTGFFYITVSLLMGYVIPLFSFLGGIVAIVVGSALISNYLYLLSCVVKYDRITFQDFKQGFLVHLRLIWSISFILYVIDLAFELLLLPVLQNFIGALAASMAFTFLVLIFFNPLPEVVYQKYLNPLECFKYAFGFIKENWLEWFVPNVILMGVLYLLTGTVISQLFNFVVLPYGAFLGVGGILLYLISQLWFSFMMIYRGFLFEVLSTSTRRKRLFMRRF